MLHPDNQYVKDNYPFLWKWLCDKEYLTVADKLEPSSMAVEIIQRYDSYKVYSCKEGYVLRRFLSLHNSNVPRSVIDYKSYVSMKSYNLTLQSKDITEPCLSMAESFLSRSNSLGFRGEESKEILDRSTGLCFNVYVSREDKHCTYSLGLEGLNKTEKDLLGRILGFILSDKKERVESYLFARKERVNKEQRNMLAEMYQKEKL